MRDKKNSYLSRGDLIEVLSIDGKMIRTQASKGDEQAGEVMKYHALWKECPEDDGAYRLCERSYKEWKENSK